jgi:hypothetical protein
LIETKIPGCFSRREFIAKKASDAAGTIRIRRSRTTTTISCLRDIAAMAGSPGLQAANLKLIFSLNTNALLAFNFADGNAPRF